MNNSGRNLAERLMKTMDIWYNMLPGLRPAVVGPPEDMPGPPLGPGGHSRPGIKESYRVLMKSRISLRGSIPRLKPFPEISRQGLPRCRGRSPQERPWKPGGQQSQDFLWNPNVVDPYCS